MLLYSSHLHLAMDVQQTSSSICTCAASNQMRRHQNKRTIVSLSPFSYDNCHCLMNSAKHRTYCAKRHSGTDTKHDYNKKNTRHHLKHMNVFVYLYSLLCILCMVTSCVSMENIVIEDQLTQVGHFFFYNISTNASPVKDPVQLKVGIRVCTKCMICCVLCSLVI